MGQLPTGDNGPKFTSRVLDQWAYDHGVRLQFIEPGKPIQNTFIESCNSWLREECLNEHVFVSLADPRRKIEAWRQHYNRLRPHSSIGALTPAGVHPPQHRHRTDSNSRWY